MKMGLPNMKTLLLVSLVATILMKSECQGQGTWVKENVNAERIRAMARAAVAKIDATAGNSPPSELKWIMEARSQPQGTVGRRTELKIEICQNNRYDPTKPKMQCQVCTVNVMNPGKTEINVIERHFCSGGSFIKH